MIQVTLRNGVETKAFLKKVEIALREQLPSLFRTLGDVYVHDVKKRIITQNNGMWAPASKWLKAKNGHTRVLDGMEKYVRARVSQKQLAIVSTARNWTLSMHHEGFENKLVGPGEKMDQHGRVELKIRDGRPLNLYTELKNRRDASKGVRSQTFSFVPKNPGRTPPRKIWPREDEAIKLGNPPASAWLRKIIRDAGGSLVRG
jgi:hypothetical protein